MRRLLFPLLVLALALPAGALALTPTTRLAPGPTVAGTASWYPTTLGWSDVAHLALPYRDGGRYRPRTAGSRVPVVRVCAGARCVDAYAVDSCLCPGRIADLSRTTITALGLDPRTGLYRVTLERTGSALAPTATPTPTPVAPPRPTPVASPTAEPSPEPTPG